MAESGNGSMGKSAGIAGGLGCLVIVALLAAILAVPLLIAVLAGGIAGQLSLESSEGCAEPVSADGGGAVNVPKAFQEPTKKAAKVAGLPEQTVAAQIKA